MLDPFVRLHRIDENAAGEVAAVLSCLRRLERTCQSAVLLVHHVRKGAGHLRAGQALRGSSELHAWGDSNLYLRRRGTRLRLSVEHRAAAAPDDLFLRLPVDDEHLRLEIDDAATDTPVDAAAPTAHQRIYTALAAAATPLTLQQLRTAHPHAHLHALRHPQRPRRRRLHPQRPRRLQPRPLIASHPFPFPAPYGVIGKRKRETPPRLRRLSCNFREETSLKKRDDA